MNAHLSPPAFANDRPCANDPVADGADWAQDALRGHPTGDMTMNARNLLPSVLLAATLVSGLTACAGTPREPRQTYQQEMDELDASCRARGGILTLGSGTTTGRPQTDYFCEIRGGGGRLNSGGN